MRTMPAIETSVPHQQNGGRGRAPARDRFLPFSQPYLGEEEIEAVVSCLRSGWLTSGLRVQEFERDFAAYIGCKHALAVNSCTAALHLALEAVGVGPGDEVITSPMTFAATAAVIEHLGARPVLADCEAATLNLDPAQLAARITSRTRAIVPVHFAGQPCAMDAILDLARAHRLPVVEDAAHALPARYDGRLVGTLGSITCFSFYATKTMTTGEGGMVVTDDDLYAERMRVMRLHGMTCDAWKRYAKDGSWSYDILAAGFKYNLTDVAASIGIQQLKRSDSFLARRRHIARRYSEAFGGLRGLRAPTVADDADHAWHLYVVQLVPEVLTIDRDEFIRELTALNIGVAVHFIPLHLHSYYRYKYGYQPTDFPNAYFASRRIVSLPLYPKMTDGDVEDVIAAVSGLIEGHQR
jgi:dTDP-4-amino-4,6-dideoxygalactose transaminase